MTQHLGPEIHIYSIPRRNSYTPEYLRAGDQLHQYAIARVRENSEDYATTLRYVMNQHPALAKQYDSPTGGLKNGKDPNI